MPIPNRSEVTCSGVGWSSSASVPSPPPVTTSPPRWTPSSEEARISVHRRPLSVSPVSWTKTPRSAAVSANVTLLTVTLAIRINCSDADVSFRFIRLQSQQTTTSVWQLLSQPNQISGHTSNASWCSTSFTAQRPST